MEKFFFNLKNVFIYEFLTIIMRKRISTSPGTYCCELFLKQSYIITADLRNPHNLKYRGPQGFAITCIIVSFIIFFK